MRVNWSCHVVFFFKHKTANEMRISDWSSDVCSSDLSAIGLQLAEIDPVILALEIMDHVAQDGDDVEFLAVDPRDVRDRKAIAGEIGRHLVLEDKTGMDLETLTAAQMDVLEGVEEAGEQVDIADQKSARLDEWLEIVRGLGEITRAVD